VCVCVCVTENVSHASSRAYKGFSCHPVMSDQEMN